jgi:hypothetical protein
MRMDVRHACHAGPARDHLLDAPVGEFAAFPLVQPQLRAEALLALLADPQVPVDRERGLGAERHTAHATPLAEHPGELLLQVQMRRHLVIAWDQHQTSDLRQAQPGVTEKPDDRLVADVDEGPGLAGSQDGQDVINGDNRWGRLAKCWRSKVRHRGVFDLLLGD